MKKNEFPNKDLKIEYVETYEKEVTEKRKKEFESKLAKIPTIEEKLKFAETELDKYLKNVPAEVIFVSGQTKIQGALFFDRHIKIEIENIKKKLENEKEIPKKKANAEKLPTTFDELVHYEYSIQPFIDILKEVEPPLIDVNYNFIGKSKGAVVIWIEELYSQAIIKKPTNSDKVFSSLLPQKIIGLKISDSTFRKGRKIAEKNYKKDLKTLISKEKNSQISHNGKLGK